MNSLGFKAVGSSDARSVAPHLRFGGFVGALVHYGRSAADLPIDALRDEFRIPIVLLLPDERVPIPKSADGVLVKPAALPQILAILRATFETQERGAETLEGPTVLEDEEVAFLAQVPCYPEVRKGLKNNALLLQGCPKTFDKITQFRDTQPRLARRSNVALQMGLAATFTPPTLSPGKRILLATAARLFSVAKLATDRLPKEAQAFTGRHSQLKETLFLGFANELKSDLALPVAALDLLHGALLGGSRSDWIEAETDLLAASCAPRRSAA